MKILSLFNRIPFPPNDGGAIAIYYLLKHLHLQGHEVHLAAVNTRKHHADPKSMRGIASVLTTDIDTQVTPFGAFSSYFSRIPYIAKRFYDPEFERKLIALIRNTHFDIVQVDLAYTMVYAPTIKAHSNAPLVFRPHNVESELWSRTAVAERNLLKKMYLNRMADQIRSFELHMATLADKIIAITERDAAYFRSELPDKAVVAIPAGIEMETYDVLPEISPEPFTLCFLGSLEWTPNLQGLTWFIERVWPRIREAIPEACFHIAGKNPPDHLFHNPSPGVFIHGQVDSAPIFLRQYESMVVPLLAGGGMRLKMVEGMAAGLPIISTPVGAEGIDGISGEHFILAESPEAFADACIQVLRHRELRHKLALAATALARNNYDWARLTQKFVAEYRAFPN